MTMISRRSRPGISDGTPIPLPNPPALPGRTPTITDLEDEEETADLLFHSQRAVRPAVFNAAIAIQGKRIQVARVPFDDVTMEQAIAQVAAMARERDRARFVCTGNLDHLVQLRRDAEFRAAYAAADLILADGMPVVWLSRLSARGPLRERVAGSDLFWELARVSAEEGLRLFFLGGAPGSAVAAAAAVCRKHPAAKVCGTYCPSFEHWGTEGEEARISRAVVEAGPDILLVGLGAPKQEKWISANKDRLGVPVSIGVGGSFELACGAARRAPVWMQRSGLEWSYRLVQDPRRLWRRYLCADLPYFVTLAAGAAYDAARRGGGTR